MRIAINGFGRIGRHILKLALENNINVVAINDVYNIHEAAYLLKYDSIYRVFNKPIFIEGNFLSIDNKKIKFLKEKNLSNMPWKELDIDLVIDSSGRSNKRENVLKHIIAGAKRVMVTAAMENQDITIIYPVNNENLKEEHKIISLGSCSAVCLTPILKILDKAFGIQKGIIIDIHPYTNDQKLHDSHHKKIRRGRAAGINIIPTSSSSLKSIIDVLPELKDKFIAHSVRVPVVCGALIELVLTLNKDFGEKEINELFKRKSEEMKGILQYSEENLVSSDVIGNSNSAVIDGLSTKKIGNELNLLVWHDNEYSYASRVIDVIKNLKEN